MVLNAHQWVVTHFGGDYVRAGWFLDECRTKSEVGGTGETFYSIKGKTHKTFYTRRP